jgi:hypothetical protein
MGYDGHLQNLTHLEIPKENFISHNLERPIQVSRMFDLAICLEVAEHLPERSAKTLIQSLCSISDFVLFSAAIPGQGGLHHQNEQWQEYWVAQFEKEDFIPFDFIRPRIWNDSKISFWYRQNILLFANKKRSPELKLLKGNNFTANMVHPDLYAHKLSLVESAGEKCTINILAKRILKKFTL